MKALNYIVVFNLLHNSKKKNLSIFAKIVITFKKSLICKLSNN